MLSVMWHTQSLPTTQRSKEPCLSNLRLELSLWLSFKRQRKPRCKVWDSADKRFQTDFKPCKLSHPRAAYTSLSWELGKQEKMRKGKKPPASSWLHQQTCQSTKPWREKSFVTSYRTNPTGPLGGHYQHRRNAATRPLSAHPRSTRGWCLAEQVGTHTHTCVYPTPSPGHSAKGLVVALQLWEQVISCHLCPSKGTDPDRKFPTKYESPQSFFSLSLSTWCHHRRRQLCQSK